MSGGYNDACGITYSARYVSQLQAQRRVTSQQLNISLVQQIVVEHARKPSRATR
jgi:hypothetical protein